MRRFVVRVSAMATAMVMTLGVASASTMDPMNDNWDPWVEVNETVTAAGPGKAVVGQVFLDANYFNSSRLFADFTGQTCESIDEGLCAKAGMVTMQTVLPHCSSRRTADCIEGFFARDGSGRIEATRAGTFVPDGASTFPEIKLFDGTTLPGSGELSLWRLPRYPHSGGDLYAVSMILSGVLARGPAGWMPQPLEVSVQVMPVSRMSQTDEFASCRDADNIDGDQCLATDYRLPDERFGVSVRVGSSFGSWVFGRVADLSIDVREERDQNLLTVSGRPAVVPHAVASTGCDPASTFLGEFCPYFGTRLALNDAGSSLSLDAWRKWATYVGQQSDALIRKWSFRSNEAQSSSLSQCLTDGQVAGWISTNAMVFAAEPPRWNGTALDFSVAGPPLTPTSERASADYEFFLRSSVARCLWPGRDVAKQATVQVINAGESSEVTTTSASESQGWVRFVARNFGFPDVPQARSGSDALSRSSAFGRTPTISVSVGSKIKRYASCKAMNKDYRDGASRPGAGNVVIVKGKRVDKPALGKPLVSAGLYQANARLDTDRDGLVCEREPSR